MTTPSLASFRPSRAARSDDDILSLLLAMMQVVEKQPKNLTALQLPQLDLPMPEKPQIDLPSVPAVPIYQFQLPDIQSEVESAVLPVADKVKSLLSQV